MFTRILTALIGVVVFFLALAVPTQYFPLIIFVVATLMLYEMYGVLKCGALVNTAGFLSAVAVFAAMNRQSSIFGLVLFGIITVYLITVILKHGKKSCKDILAHGFITLYLSLSMLAVAQTATEFTIFGVLWIFVIAWLTDSGAYFAGVFLGKHKLCPTISPKKTVEGAIGGVLASVLAGIAYYFIIIELIKPELEFNAAAFVGLALMCFAGAMLSQLGDLVASCIKRDCAVKDYGSVLPGHGGFMDRFDSVVFIAPFVFLILTILKSLSVTAIAV